MRRWPGRRDELELVIGQGYGSRVPMLGSDGPCRGGMGGARTERKDEARDDRKRPESRVAERLAAQRRAQASPLKPRVRQEIHVDPSARRCRKKITNPTTRKAKPIARKARCPEMPMATKAAPSAMKMIPGVPARFMASPRADPRRRTACGSAASVAERSESAAAAGSARDC